MDNQQCDQCGDGYQVPTQAAHSPSASGGRLASYYCTDINCLQVTYLVPTGNRLSMSYEGNVECRIMNDQFEKEWSMKYIRQED